MSLHLATDGDVAVLTLDRPPVNAIDLEMVRALTERLSDLARADPKGLVLAGAGKAFSAGVDTRAFGSYGPADLAEMILGITRMITALYSLPCPVVTAVGGHAMGGGFVLMLAGDVHIATDDPAARLGLQEAQAGIPFPAGPLEVIRAELPAPLLRRLTLTSAAVSTAELHALGILDSLHPREALPEAAIARVHDLAGQPGFRVVKEQIRRPVVERLEALVATGRDPLIAFLSAPKPQVNAPP